jgi:hypothetical protein
LEAKLADSSQQPLHAYESHTMHARLCSEASLPLSVHTQASQHLVVKVALAN